MHQSDEMEAPAPTPIAESPIQPAVLAERRRPGRMASVHLTLLSLLRGETVPVGDLEDGWGHDLVPSTGIAVSVLFSCLIWAIAGFSLWRVFGG